MAKKVYVGLSGGVDSSVTAALLQKEGYQVVGVYMKNWTKNLPGFECPWKEDFQDAKRIAVQLSIPFKVFDFEKQYKQKVVDYMINEYQAGRTPNPDVMCNQEVKFKLFLEAALEDGADLIATGHYAKSEEGTLRQARDQNKDQTYFLYRITEEALTKTLFPLGGYTKPEVRQLATEFKLVTATKKESMGICFVGKVGIKEFLQQYVHTEPGQILDQNGRVVGEHDGAIFYTIGQRQGLGIGGGLPYYVVGKDMAKNEVYVTTDLSDSRLWHSVLNIADVHWIGQPVAEQKAINNKQYEGLQIRTRHRAKLIDVKKIREKNTGGVSTIEVQLSEEIRALTPGQSAVIYNKKQVLGGGIII